MKIFKGKYGWSTSAHSKDINGKDIKCYVDVQFQKGYEPLLEEIEGGLVFKDTNGVERNCFLSSYQKKDGSVHPKLVVMGGTGKDSTRTDTPKSVQTSLTGTNKDVTGLVIEPDELPFY